MSTQQEKVVKSTQRRDTIPAKADRNEEIQRLADLTLTIHKRLKQLARKSETLVEDSLAR